MQARMLVRSGMVCRRPHRVLTDSLSLSDSGFSFFVANSALKKLVGFGSFLHSGMDLLAAIGM
jgi:hypothetical protein